VLALTCVSSHSISGKPVHVRNHHSIDCVQCTYIEQMYAHALTHRHRHRVRVRVDSHKHDPGISKIRVHSCIDCEHMHTYHHRHRVRVDSREHDPTVLEIRVPLPDAANDYESLKKQVCDATGFNCDEDDEHTIDRLIKAELHKVCVVLSLIVSMIMMMIMV
jgi:hypothetical protein